jgi:hypothetical protein
MRVVAAGRCPAADDRGCAAECHPTARGTAQVHGVSPFTVRINPRLGGKSRRVLVHGVLHAVARTRPSCGGQRRGFLVHGVLAAVARIGLIRGVAFSCMRFCPPRRRAA